MPITRKVITTTKKEIEEYDSGTKTTDIPTNSNETLPGVLPGTSSTRKNVTGEDLQVQESDNSNACVMSDNPVTGRTYADLYHEILRSPPYPYIATIIYMLAIFFTLKTFTYTNFFHSIIVGTSLFLVFVVGNIIICVIKHYPWGKSKIRRF